MTPSIENIHLNLDGWDDLPGEPNSWIRQGPDMLRLFFFDQPSVLPCSFADVECWRDHFSQMVQQQNGAMVSADVLPIQGMNAVRTIFKFRQPKMGALSDMGIVFLGTWMIPFAQFAFNIQIQGFEAGTTGMREAAVFAMLPREPEPDPEPPIQVASMDEMFERMKARPLRRLPSDDEQYDAAFPHHPLSRVRAELTRIADTLRVDNAILSAAPYVHPR
jgi:hypothetical protein